ncbi:MAG: ABC transporter ATP-binding protein [Pseudomonadota bacterium]
MSEARMGESRESGGVIGITHHDERIDIDTEISSAEALRLLWRCLKLLSEVRGWFAAKLVLGLGALGFGLFVPWLAKIVIDNVILQKPLSDNDVPYPPFMHPILTFLEGQTPLEIMFTLSMMFLIGMVLVGFRSEGVSAQLFGSPLTGQDETGAAENKVSSSYSEAGGLWGLVEYWVGVRLTQYVANNIRTRLFARLTRLPMTTLTEKRTGDSIYRVLYDTASIPQASVDMTLSLTFALLGSLINMYLIQYSYGRAAPEIVWITWTILPMMFVLTLPAANLMRRINQNNRSAGSATTNAMEETVSNMDAVQSLGGMQQEVTKFADRSNESYFRQRVALVVGGLLFVVCALAALAVALWVTIIITDGIIEGVMSPGDFGVLLAIFFGIAFGAIELGIFWLNLQIQVAPARRIFFYMDYESDDDDVSGDVLDEIGSEVSIEHVDFFYPDGRQALKDVDLRLPMNHVVALVGPSGAGKTSLAYLIPGFLKPSRGRVCIDGRDLTTLNIDSLRSHVAYVFQEHLLLAESIADNLRLAKPGASEEEILKALTTAGCMSFVDELPEGIHTVLGREGNTLSVGQQQRLCIARGIIREARILILDEPTAALDPETENALFESLQTLSQDRLLIVIAHRLSTIRRADHIVFMEEGGVVASGTHDELMADATGRYRRFVELQS